VGTAILTLAQTVEKGVTKREMPLFKKGGFG